MGIFCYLQTVTFWSHADLKKRTKKATSLSNKDGGLQTTRRSHHALVFDRAFIFYPYLRLHSAHSALSE